MKNQSSVIAAHFHALAAALTVFASPGVWAESPRVHFLTFPASDVEALGEVAQLNVVVDCSWIISLKNVPELYDIEMGYDMPTQNLLEARPRLGAAAVALSQWSAVIGVRIPPDADSRSCFKVVVSAHGITGASRTWRGTQLGLPR